MKTLKLGDKVKLKKKWIKITDKLDKIRDAEGKIRTGVPYIKKIKKSYIIDDFDSDGDVGIMLDKEDDFVSYFYDKAIKKIKNKKD